MTKSTTRRLTGAVAAVGMAASVSLMGAGAANAQHSVTFSSDSSLSFDRDSQGRVLVQYDNRSGRDLECSVVVSNNSVVNGLASHVRNAADPVIAYTDAENWPTALQARVNQAIEDGQFNVGEASVAKGYSGVLNIDGGTDFPMTTGFSLHGFSMCAGETGDPDAFYIEFERSVGGGIFGSVENLFGSAS